MLKYLTNTYFQAFMATGGIFSLFQLAHQQRKKAQIIKSELALEALYYIHSSEEFQKNFNKPLSYVNGLMKQSQIKINNEDSVTEIKIPYKAGKDKGIVHICATKKPLKELNTKFYQDNYYINERDTKSLIDNQEDIDSKEMFYNIDLIKLENQRSKNYKNILISPLNFDQDFLKQSSIKKTYQDIHFERKLRRQYIKNKFGNHTLERALQQYKNQDQLQNRFVVGQLIFGTIALCAMFVNVQIQKISSTPLSNSLIIKNYQQQILSKIQQQYGINHLYFNKTILGGIIQKDANFELMFHGKGIYGKAFFQGKYKDDQTIELDQFQLKCDLDGNIQYINMMNHQ